MSAGGRRAARAARKQEDAESNERYTPQWVRRCLEEIAGAGHRKAPIALDPCTPAHNPMGARRFYTRREDGLRQSWRTGGLVYVNAPYGRGLVQPWIDCAIRQRASYRQCVFLTAGDFTTGWSEALHQLAWVSIDVRERMRFGLPDGTVSTSGADFPSTLWWAPGSGPVAQRTAVEMLGRFVRRFQDSGRVRPCAGGPPWYIGKPTGSASLVVRSGNGSARRPSKSNTTGRLNDVRRTSRQAPRKRQAVAQ